MEVARRNRDGMKSVFYGLEPINVAGAGTKKPKVCHYYQSGKCYRKNCHFLHFNSFEDGIPTGKGNKRGQQQLLDRHQNLHTPVLMMPRNLDHVLHFNGSQDSLVASNNVAQLSVCKARTVSSCRKSSKTVMRPCVNCLKTPTHTDPALKTILKSVRPPKSPLHLPSKNCMTSACGSKNDFILYWHGGLLGLYGTHDSKGVPIVLCSCNDKLVKLYSLPLGRAFSKGEVRSLRAAPGGLLFTGDEAKADQSLEMVLKGYCPTNFNYMIVN